MLVKTPGIVLRYIKYRESSIIVNIYTEALGLQGYIVNSVRSSRARKNRIALYQPLTLLDLVAYYRERSNLQRISEARCQHPFYRISSDPKRSAVALFMVEVLGKTLKEQEANTPLFTFLWESIVLLDSEHLPVENFHLLFLVQLSKYLGFQPQSAESILEQVAIFHPGEFRKADTPMLEDVLTSDYLRPLPLGHTQRMRILKLLLTFYDQQVERFEPIRSLPVLNQVFSP